MEFSVRRAESGDAARIAGFALKLFAQHQKHDPERFADLSNSDGAEHFYAGRTHAADALIFVAEAEGKIAGFVYAELERMNYPELLENAVWVHDLYIDESLHGMGAGKALIGAVTAAARNENADKLVLTVAAKNESAKAFSRRVGFRETMIEMTMGLND